jgi:tetratricopeptide (TPR) repeat protein
MKAGLFSIFMLLGLAVLGQSSLKQAQSLIDAQKYRSAFAVLEAADPAHQSAPILIKQCEILLDYYIVSDKHLQFSLKDLEPEEHLEELRTEAPDLPKVKFRIDSLLYFRLEEEPDNLELHLALGRYFLEVYQKFKGESFYPEQMLLTRMEMHCALAYKRGAKDRYSTYALGMKKLLDKEPLAAIPFFEDHISLNPRNAEVYFNLALAYQIQNRRLKSIESALNAMEFYEDPALKAEAARMIAVSYAHLNDTIRSLEFLELADQIEPGNYFTLKYILQTQALVDTVAFADTRKRFFQLGPAKNKIYQDLYRMHLNHGWEANLVQFYESELLNFSTDTLVRAQLNLHRAILYKDLKNQEACNAAVAEAVSDFKLVYPPNHDIFRFIGSYFRDERTK